MVSAMLDDTNEFDTLLDISIQETPINRGIYGLNKAVNTRHVIVYT